MSTWLQANSDAFWIIVTGCLIASNCALLGSFLMLRKVVLIGDAISHAVLPGLVLAYLLTGSRTSLVMIVGAGLAGLVAVLMISWFQRQGQVQEDAAIGVSFSFLFAVGVILVSLFTGHVDLDIDCVLFGEIIYVPFDTWTLGGVTAPQAAWLAGGLLLFNLLVLALGYKQLKVCSFDPQLAESLGINTALWHYILMGCVSLTMVISFQSVGAILVIALLAVPPNTAYLLTDRLGVLLVWAVFLGCLNTVFGYSLAAWTDTSVAGCIATAGGIVLALTVFLSPTHGLLASSLARRRALTQTPDLSQR